MAKSFFNTECLHSGQEVIDRSNAVLGMAFTPLPPRKGDSVLYRARQILYCKVNKTKNMLSKVVKKVGKIMKRAAKSSHKISKRAGKSHHKISKTAGKSRHYVLSHAFLVLILVKKFLLVFIR
jgi:hypothetical protein